MNVKNLLLNAIEWLRRRVAALRDTRGVYVNDNDNVDDDDDRDDNDDGNVVGATFNSQFSIFNSKHSRVGLDWETHQTILKTEDSFDFQWRATP